MMMTSRHIESVKGKLNHWEGKQLEGTLPMRWDFEVATIDVVKQKCSLSMVRQMLTVMRPTLAEGEPVRGPKHQRSPDQFPPIAGEGRWE